MNEASDAGTPAVATEEIVCAYGEARLELSAGVCELASSDAKGELSVVYESEYADVSAVREE